MKCAAHLRRNNERALSGEGSLVLIIVAAIIGICGWFVWQYYKSTEEDARAYAEHSLHQLLFVHDAHYFDANLSATARPGYPPSQQRYILFQLTKLGVPVGPARLDGTVSYNSGQRSEDAQGHFIARVVYPAADAHAYIDIVRRNDRWRIDSFTCQWENKPAPTASVAP
jgi:hypothetical protein